MATIDDVRQALWEAYSKLAATEYGVEGKSYEAYVEVTYPTWWHAKDREDFCRPDGLKVYSYALGPSRMHHFKRADIEDQPNYYTWRGPDPFATAVRVIRKWAEEVSENA